MDARINDKIITGTTRHITASALEHWLQTAEPGAWLTYAVGGLLRDKYRQHGKELRRVGRTAWDAYKRGEAHLFQRKTAEHLRSWGGDPQLVIEVEYLIQRTKYSAPSSRTSTAEKSDT